MKSTTTLANSLRKAAKAPFKKYNDLMGFNESNSVCRMLARLKTSAEIDLFMISRGFVRFKDSRKYTQIGF